MCWGGLGAADEHASRSTAHAQFRTAARVWGELTALALTRSNADIPDEVQLHATRRHTRTAAQHTHRCACL